MPTDKPSPLYPLLSLSRLRMETDGDGVTTLVAGAGCGLKCRYCLNKRILAEKAPEWIPPETLYERTRIDNLYFQATGGGLCFGGGEALLHTDFIAAFRALIGDVWKLTAETSLHVPEDAVRKAAGCVDRFIVDIKTLDAGIYRAYTGADNAAVIKNLQTLIGLTGPARVKLRVPLIPAYNTPGDRENSVKLLKEMGYTDFDLFEYSVKKELIRKSFRFSGRVQGVGFRWRAMSAANALGATGWVRNEYNGDVTMELQGTREQIDGVILAVERGTYVQIDDMRVQTATVAENERGFTVKDDE